MSLPGRLNRDISFSKLDDHKKSSPTKNSLMSLLMRNPDLVHQLNDRAVSYIQNNQYGLATKSLNKALRMAEKQNCSYKTKEMSISNISLESSEASTNKTPFKHRAEYDEGMDYFKHPIMLGNCSNRSLAGTILYNLARCHHNQAHYDDALSLYKRSLRTLEVWPTTDEQLTVSILFGIGQIQYIRGDHADSLKTYNTALGFSRAKFGESSLQVAATLNCIGVLHYIMPKGDSETALQALQTSIQVRLQQLGPHHIDVGTTYNNIGRIYFQQAQYEDAMDAYRKSLKIRRTEQGDSVDVAATICT